jgi:acetylglutamate kinase
MGLPDRFYSGMRVTDDQTLHVVEMVLSEVNQEIVGLINRHGGRAVGLDGQDGRFIRARRMNTREESVTSDVGLVGDIVSIDPELIDLLQSREFIPVVMAVGAGVEGEAYSVDAGVLAGKLAEALNAEMLILMTDAQGVVDGSHRLVSSISASGIEALLADGVIAGEMAVHAVVVAGAVRHGVKSAHIIDARIPNALLLEVLTSEGMGTMIASDEGLHFLTDSREYLAPR